MIMVFTNRIDAGRKLSVALKLYAKSPNHLIVALPRGGVIVTKEVAVALQLPLDFISVRKIGVPQFPELAMGAIAGDEVYLDQKTVEMAGATEAEIARIIESEKQETAQRNE